MRRQFADPELKTGERVERQVISYPGVYMRVVPELANCIVFMLAGKDMVRPSLSLLVLCGSKSFELDVERRTDWLLLARAQANLYHSMAERLATGDTSLLASTHAVSSGLKVYVSTRTVAGIEVFRRTLGGHGMMAATGVGRVFATELPAQTYEGENGVLSLQVARAALKSLAAASQGGDRARALVAESPFDAYLGALAPRPQLPVAAPSSGTDAQWTDRAFLTRLLALRAALSVVRLAERMQRDGAKFGDLSWECNAVSDAVVEAFLAKRTGEMLDQLEGAGDRERDVMQRVVNLVRPGPSLSLSLPLAPSADSPFTQTPAVPPLDPHQRARAPPRAVDPRPLVGRPAPRRPGPRRAGAPARPRRPHRQLWLLGLGARHDGAFARSLPHSLSLSLSRGRPA